MTNEKKQMATELHKEIVSVYFKHGLDLRKYKYANRDAIVLSTIIAKAISMKEQKLHTNNVVSWKEFIKSPQGIMTTLGIILLILNLIK